MARARVQFRQADVKRAVSGAAAAGLKVTRVEIDPATGKIVLSIAAVEETVVQSPLELWRRESGQG